MSERIQNPHTFDMSNYFSGLTYEVGGRDFDREEDEAKSETHPKADRPRSFELDWSFLKTFPKTKTH